MLDYIFHHPDSLQHFTKFLQSKSIPHERRDDVLGMVIAIPEDLEDELQEEVETCYESLQQEQESLLFEQEDGEGAGKTRTALTVQLANGETVYASIPADMMRRLLAVLKPEEIGQLVDAIAGAVENPDLRPVCKR
jgi:hypothetical protein